MASVNIIVHYPDSESARKDLGQRVASVHAQAILEYIGKMNTPDEQKCDLVDMVNQRYILKHGG